MRAPPPFAAARRLTGHSPKTVACVLMFAMGRAEFPVDTHVWRISMKLGWAPPSSTRETCYEHMNRRVPDQLKFDLHCLLVDHGKVWRPCRAAGMRTGLTSPPPALRVVRREWPTALRAAGRLPPCCAAAGRGGQGAAMRPRGRGGGRWRGGAGGGQARQAGARGLAPIGIQQRRGARRGALHFSTGNAARRLRKSSGSTSLSSPSGVPSSSSSVAGSLASSRS